MTSNRQQLYDSLQSDLCPACGASKTPMQSLCRRCYFSLPKTLRDDLYQLFGDGYEPAMRAAFKRLGVEQPHLPITAINQE